MPISNKIAHGLEEVDVIICGGLLYRISISDNID